MPALHHSITPFPITPILHHSITPILRLLVLITPFVLVPSTTPAPAPRPRLPVRHASRFTHHASRFTHHVSRFSPPAPTPRPRLPIGPRPRAPGSPGSSRPQIVEHGLSTDGNPPSSPPESSAGHAAEGGLWTVDPGNPATNARRAGPGPPGDYPPAGLP